MFKQMTDFEKYNIFLGGEEDLLYYQTDGKRITNNFVEFVDEFNNVFENFDETLNTIFEKVKNGNVYIVTQYKKAFIDRWIVSLINYLK